MKSRIVPISNVARLQEAGQLLLNRAPNTPGMGLVWGDTGLGKTTACVWYMNQCNAVFVRAMALWTPTTMLKAILRELAIEPRQSSCAEMAMLIVDKLAEGNRPLFIDEADFILDKHRMVETLRDLHDLASVPVILIGMAGIQNKLGNKLRQLTGRMMRWVEFQPATMNDALMLADQLCEVQVAEDLVAMLHASTSGHVRNIIVGLAQIETLARREGLDIVRAKDWPKRASFFFAGKATPTPVSVPEASPMPAPAASTPKVVTLSEREQR